MSIRTRARRHTSAVGAALAAAALIASCSPPSPEAPPSPTERPAAARPTTTTTTTTTTAPSVGPPSGESSCAPRTQLPGWRLTISDDIGSPVAAGAFPAATGGRWFAYGDGWSDSSGRGRYQPSAISVRDGSLRLPVRTVSGVPRVAAVTPRIAGAPGVHGGQTYGRFAVRVRADVADGYKFVSLLWPDSERWPFDGEINFPEAELGGEVYAFMHRKGATSGSDQDWFRTSATYRDWHTYVIEWTPESVSFLLDGTLVGRSTNRLPNTDMHLVLQAETSLEQAIVPAGASGEVQVDWVAVWERAA